jgi:hypothetical protein
MNKTDKLLKDENLYQDETNNAWVAEVTVFGRFAKLGNFGSRQAALDALKATRRN